MPKLPSFKNRRMKNIIVKVKKALPELSPETKLEGNKEEAKVEVVMAQDQGRKAEINPVKIFTKQKSRFQNWKILLLNLSNSPI